MLRDDTTVEYQLNRPGLLSSLIFFVMNLSSLSIASSSLRVASVVTQQLGLPLLAY